MNILIYILLNKTQRTPGTRLNLVGDFIFSLSIFLVYANGIVAQSSWHFTTSMNVNVG